MYNMYIGSEFNNIIKTILNVSNSSDLKNPSDTLLKINMAKERNYIAENAKKPDNAAEIVTGCNLPYEVSAFWSTLLRPSFTFDKGSHPPPPNYSSSKAWAALPFMKDTADLAPSNTKYPESQVNAKADVFFVPPTSYGSKESWNAPWDNSVVRRKTAYKMRTSASVFNAACKVYAPHYRQANVWAFFEMEDASGIKAIDLAYSDIKSAFKYYINNYNNGRPFILAGHSQGSLHLKRLYDEEIKGTPLEKHMVAAYLIGWPIPKNDSNIKPSRSADDTGAFISWGTCAHTGHPYGDPKLFANAVTWRNGSYKPNNSDSIQTNPLSWKLNGEEVPAGYNPGSLPSPSYRGSMNKFPKLVPNVCGADASGKALIVKGIFVNSYSYGKLFGCYKFSGPPPGSAGFMFFDVLNPYYGNHHINDYELFYESLRGNVVLRVNEFIRKQKNKKTKL